MIESHVSFTGQKRLLLFLVTCVEQVSHDQNIILDPLGRYYSVRVGCCGFQVSAFYGWGQFVLLESHEDAVLPYRKVAAVELNFLDACIVLVVLTFHLVYGFDDLGT